MQADPEAPGACRSSARVFIMIGPLPGDGRPEETSRIRILSSADLDRDLIATGFSYVGSTPVADNGVSYFDQIRRLGCPGGVVTLTEVWPIFMLV